MMPSDRSTLSVRTTRVAVIREIIFGEELHQEMRFRRDELVPLSAR